MLRGFGMIDARESSGNLPYSASIMSTSQS